MRRLSAVLLFAALVVATPAAASAAIKIDRIQFDPPGDDNGSNTNSD